jgi:hypothetical protein
MRERVRVRMREATCADEGVRMVEDEGRGIENEGEAQSDGGGEVARVREARHWMRS